MSSVDTVCWVLSYYIKYYWRTTSLNDNMSKSLTVNMLLTGLVRAQPTPWMAWGSGQWTVSYTGFRSASYWFTMKRTMQQRKLSVCYIFTVQFPSQTPELTFTLYIIMTHKTLTKDMLSLSEVFLGGTNLLSSGLGADRIMLCTLLTSSTW